MADPASILTEVMNRSNAVYSPWILGPMPPEHPPAAQPVYLSLWPLDVNTESVAEGELDEVTRTEAHGIVIDDASAAAGAYGNAHPDAQVPPDDLPLPGPRVPVKPQPAASAIPLWGWVLGGVVVVGVLGAIVYVAQKEADR